MIGISLPIPSAFTHPRQCGGTAAVVAANASINCTGYISADFANARAALQFIVGTDAGNYAWSYTFTYLIV
jgi:hypothetical protein